MTGIALVNDSSQEATVRLTLYDTGGALVAGGGLVNPVELQLQPGEQRARTVPELFSAPLDSSLVGWIEAESEADGIAGFYLYLDYDISIFDGASHPDSGRKIIFSIAAQSGEFTSEFNLVNPGSDPVVVDVSLHRPNLPVITETGLELPGKGVLRFDGPDLFDLDQTPAHSYLSVLSSGPLAGFQFVRKAGGDIIGLNSPLQDQGLAELFFPQMAVLGPWETELGLVNHGDEAALIDVFAYRSDGTLFAAPFLGGSNPAVVALPAQQARVLDLGELFGFQSDSTLDGWIRVRSTSARIAGFINYGVPASGSWASVAAQAVPLKSGLFSHIATTFGYFTGVAILNPNSLSTGFSISAHSQDGSLLGSYSGILEPGQRESQLLTELVEASADRSAGYFRVNSELPVFMTSLFGTSRILANIPPQPGDEGEAPVPGLKVAPSIAVVQPGRPFQFRVDGAGGAVEWAVRGEPSVTGAINSAGVYTAPASAPTRLPVTVSASSGTSSAAASVDVLTKEQLLAEVGVVQAVAYLRGLQRLYTSETFGSSASARGPFRAQVGAPSSRIAGVAPGLRVELAEFPDELITKIIPYRSSLGSDFLLLLSKTQGRVIRFNPVNRSRVTIIQGLNAPDSMVFDETAGTLLIADQSEIRSFGRAVVEANPGNPAAASLASGRSFPSQEEFSQFSGIAVDQCTGNLVIADRAQGRVLTLDRTTGIVQTLAEDLTAPEELLALYRTGTPCPEAFNLLVSDPGTGRVYLVNPALGEEIEWIGDEPLADLAFLPRDNPVTFDTSVVFAEFPTTTSEGATSRLTYTGIADLYSDRPGNPPPRPDGPLYGDPAGDTFTENQPVDILGFEVRFAGTETAIFLQDSGTTDPSEGAETVVLLLVSGTTEPGVDMSGSIDFDTDQDQRTGATSRVDRDTALATGLGVEYSLDLDDFDPVGRTFALLKWNAIEWEEVGRVPVEAEYDPPGLEGTTLIRLRIPWELIGNAANFDVAVAVGNGFVITDAVPNRGFIRFQAGQ